MKRLFNILLCCALLTGCSSTGDEIHIFSDNEDSNINVNEGGGCLTCLDAVTELDLIVLDRALCDEGLADYQVLKDCAQVIPDCNAWSKGQEPMNEHCFNLIFETKVCKAQLFFCAAE